VPGTRAVQVRNLANDPEPSDPILEQAAQPSEKLRNRVDPPFGRLRCRRVGGLAHVAKPTDCPRPSPLRGATLGTLLLFAMGVAELVRLGSGKAESAGT
jgi:hypothetical protein